MEMNYDENTLHQLEDELHTAIYPGTEVMTDVGSVHFLKGGAEVLVPQPSSDPHDPLNWSPKWKFSAMSVATAVSFAQGFGPLAGAPMFPALMEAFDSDLAGVVQFTGVCILVLGFSNCFWVPIQTTFGRRPVLLISTLICIASNIWRALATDYSSFMGACILNGIGAGPAEASQPTIIADVIFLHERGAYNTLYFTAYFGSLMAGPIIAGVMTSYSNWRNFWWLNVALLSVVFIMLVFFFPETKWHRPHPSEIIHATTSSEEDIKSHLAVSDPEKVVPNSPKHAELEISETQAADPSLGKGTPSKQQFMPFQSHPHPFKSLLADFLIPWKISLFPIVEFAAFVVSWSASSFLTVNLTQAQVFAAPPYNFSSVNIGYTNFALLIGALIGLATNGKLSDWIATRSTRKNRGIREPEMRLPTLIPYVCIMLLGNFIVAFGYQQKWDWRIIVIIGYTCAGIQVAAIPAIASTYAIDSYKPVAGSIFVAITVNKNLWGYGFSKFITPWSLQSGFVPPIMLNMSLIFLWCSFGIVFYFVGKTCRRWSSKSSVHKM